MSQEDNFGYFPEEANVSTPSASGNFKDDVFKKWFKTGGKSGFLAVGTWLEAGKAYVDIGDNTGGEAKATKVFTDALQLATFLRAVYDGNGDKLYYKRGELPTSESFVYYGGAKVDGSPVSRVLKIHHWQTDFDKENPKFDSRSFVWKTGHFHARQVDSGAFIPDKSKPPISMNMIKVSRVEMAEMHYRLELALHHFMATGGNDPFRKLNGNDR